MRRADQIQQIGAALMVGVSLVVVSVLAYQGNEQAQGALISILAAGTGFFLRGRVERPVP